VRFWRSLSKRREVKGLGIAHNGDSHVKGASQFRFLVLGRIVNVWGLKGEVKAFSFAGQQLSFQQLRGAYLRSGDEVRYFPLERLRVRHPFLLLKFQGIHSVEEAKALIGREVCISREEAPSLPEGSYYHADIIGFHVKSEAGEELGEVVEIWPMPANDVYLVHGRRGEWLLPAVRQIILKVDLEQGLIIIRPMEGLLEAEAV